MRWRRILIALAVCGALAAIVFVLIPREPKYEGRRLSEWIKLSAPRKSPDPETTHAIEAVRHIGTNGLPWLIKWIDAKDPPAWKYRVIGAIEKLSPKVGDRLMPHLLGEYSYQIRRRMALDGFLILGPQASSAVPDLLRISTSSNRGAAASGALESIGIAGLPAALNTLTNRANSVGVRVAAGVWIDRIDPKAENELIVSLMAQCLRDKIADLEPIAARVLSQHRVEPDLVMPIFITWLTNSNSDTRWGGTAGLRQYGERATSAIPALVVALKDPHPLVRQGAEDALFEIEPAALERAEPGIAELKKHWRRSVDDSHQPASR